MRGGEARGERREAQEGEDTGIQGGRKAGLFTWLLTFVHGQYFGFRPVICATPCIPDVGHTPFNLFVVGACWGLAIPSSRDCLSLSTLLISSFCFWSSANAPKMQYYER